jgi:hypothetical protein
MDILTRTINANGGLQAVSSLNDLVESGQITLLLDTVDTGPVAISLHGTRQFRMEADLSAGKTIWIANGEGGSKQDSQTKVWIATVSATNLGALTLPVAFVRTALLNQGTSVRLMGVEQKSGRSVYRIRIQGQFPEEGHNVAIEKDLVIDALTFDILCMNDQPLPMYMSKDRSPEIGPHQLDFGNFQSVNGVRIPFSIVSSMHGQPMMKIALTQVSSTAPLPQQQFDP